MRTHLKLVTLSVAVGAALSVAYLMGYLPTQIAETTPDTEHVAPEKPEQALEQPASEETTPAPIKEAEPVEEIEPPAEPVNIAGNYEYFDEEGISAEAAAEYRRMAVLPYNPLVAECELKWTNHDGRTESIYTEVCTYRSKYPEHPYFDYDKEVLLDLTQKGDVLAAAVLSEVLKDASPSQAMALAVYSSFKSNKPDQLLKIANARYRTNGVPPKVRQDNLGPRYVYTFLAQQMGHPDADLSFADFLPTSERFLLDAKAQEIYTQLKTNTDAGIPLIADFSPFVEALKQRKEIGSSS